MTRPVVVMDIDGVLYEWEPTARFLLSRYRQIHLPPSQSWDHIQDLIGKDDWRWLWTAGVSYGLFRSGNIYTGAAEGMRQLEATGAKIILATDRPSNTREDTLLWLALHRIPFSELRLCAVSSPKWEIPADVYVDDSPDVLRCYAATGRGTVVVWDRPWNQDLDIDPSPRIVRTNDWREIYRLVCSALTRREGGSDEA